MKLRFLVFYSSLVLALSLVGCDISSSEKQTCSASGIGTAASAVSGTEGGTTTIALNATATFDVSFKVPNQCYVFDLFFQQNVDATERLITVNTKFEGCECGTLETTRTQTYTFTPTTPGNYVLKFRKSSTEFFVRNVTVTE